MARALAASFQPPVPPVALARPRWGWRMTRWRALRASSSGTLSAAGAGPELSEGTCRAYWTSSLTPGRGSTTSQSCRPTPPPIAHRAAFPEPARTWVPPEDMRRLAAYKLMAAYDSNQAGQMAAAAGDDPCSSCKAGVVGSNPTGGSLLSPGQTSSDLGFFVYAITRLVRLPGGLLRTLLPQLLHRLLHQFHRCFRRRPLRRRQSAWCTRPSTASPRSGPASPGSPLGRRRPRTTATRPRAAACPVIR